jgi:DNA-binding SARP family transcriptional activator
LPAGYRGTLRQCADDAGRGSSAISTHGPHPEVGLCLLGPVRAFHQGRELPLGGAQARSVLAVLLLSAGLTVPKDRLIACAWTDDPPPTADDLVAAYVSRLRKALAPAANGLRLRSVRPGFRADVDPALVRVDAHEFSLLMQNAGREQKAFEHELAIRTLRRALDLWGGYTEAMADLDAPWLRSQAAALGERRLDALEQLGALQLAAGQPGDAIALLADMVRLHPERESMAVTLIDSLTSSGRQAQAAQAAADAATALVRLGQRPGPELRRAQTAALARPSLAPSTRRVGPRFQLPADTGAFTGRRRELDRLLEFVHRDANAPEPPGSTGPAMTEGAERTEDAAPAPRPGRVLIAAIDGMGGIGKSALAVHLAHRVADRYPDGQLFADLRAYTLGHPPRDPHEVLETILRMLGTTPDEIPADQDGRSAMLRGRLAGTRTLILLDNALDEAQIRPLLPGSEGCLVLITSRRRLKGLDEAFSLSLDLLPDADAASLFRAVAGPGRVELTAPALTEVVDLCARLPLALRIAAAILRHRPTWGVDRLAARLRARPDRVEALTDGERDLSAIFDLSYLALPADARALYRWLGIHPGLDADVFAAAALTRTDPAAVGALFEHLVDHNLLDEPSPGRYRMHDLIRIHARGRATADEPADRSAAAAQRALGYYLATARTANRHLARRTLLVEKPECPPVHGPALATREEAAEWVRAELSNLSACVEYAREHDLPEFIVAMSAALHGYLYTHGPWSYALRLHEQAEVAAAACGDVLGRATALHCAGRVRRQTGDYSGAVSALQAALGPLYRDGPCPRPGPRPRHARPNQLADRRLPRRDRGLRTGTAALSQCTRSPRRGRRPQRHGPRTTPDRRPARRRTPPPQGTGALPRRRRPHQPSHRPHRPRPRPRRHRRPPRRRRRTERGASSISGNRSCSRSGQRPTRARPPTPARRRRPRRGGLPAAGT